MLDKLPFLALSAPSSISFTGEYAQLDAGEAKGTQGNASYLDDFEQTKRMIDKAFEDNPNLEGLIFHSDQGWQYQHKQYQRMLAQKGIRQSMSRRGNCLDNAVMENFFGLLKTEMYYRHSFTSAEHLMKEIEEYIDYYNNRRIKCKLKGLSQVQ